MKLLFETFYSCYACSYFEEDESEQTQSDLRDTNKSSAKGSNGAQDDEDEEDPLDAFMADIAVSENLTNVQEVSTSSSWFSINLLKTFFSKLKLNPISERINTAVDKASTSSSD